MIIALRRLALSRAILGVACFLATPARADLTPEWLVTSPSAGGWAAAMVVGLDGTTYVTGRSSNSDVLVESYDRNGALRWRQTFDGSASAFDSGSDLVLAPGGILYVAGSSTESPGASRDVLLLKYDSVSGVLLDAIHYGSTGRHDNASWVEVDAQGNVYVGGSTADCVGCDSDTLMLKYSASGLLQWSEFRDFGAGSGDDVFKQLELTPTGEPIALVGTMDYQRYVVLKVAPATGSTIWQVDWAPTPGLYNPMEMRIEAGGDLYVTGRQSTSLDVLATIKLRGSDGHILWQVYDCPANTLSSYSFDFPAALTLDGHGGVYITGAIGVPFTTGFDFYSVKRDASTGALLWTHSYGQAGVDKWDMPWDVSVDCQGHVYVGGMTSSPPYVEAGILLVLSAATGEEITRGVVGAGGDYSELTRLGFDSDYNIYCVDVDDALLLKYSSLVVAPSTYCTSGTSTNGCVPAVSASGTPSLSDNSGFTVSVDELEGQRQGILFYGLSGRDAKPWGGASASFLCVKSPVQRTGAQGSGGTLGLCDGGFSLDWLAYVASHPAALGTPLTVGTVVDVQAWYRDSPTGVPTRLSDAIEFVLQF